MIAEKYDPYTGTFWLTIPGFRPQRFGMGQLFVHLDDAIRALRGGWKIVDVRASSSGPFIAVVRKIDL